MTLNVSDLQKVGFFYAVPKLVDAINDGGGTGSIAAADITDATATGISLITAADAAAARTAIGASPVVAATATALATGRTISATGGATGSSAAFTGAANATIPLVLATPTGVLRGGVLQGAAVVDATDAGTVITQLNALLASLRTSGAIAP